MEISTLQNIYICYNVTRIFDYTDETHYTSRHGYLGTNQDDTRVVPIYVIGYKTNTFD